MKNIVPVIMVMLFTCNLYAARAAVQFNENYIRIVAPAGQCGILSLRPKKMPDVGVLEVISTLHGYVPKDKKLVSTTELPGLKLGSFTFGSPQPIQVVYDWAGFGTAMHYRIYCQIKEKNGVRTLVSCTDWLEFATKVGNCAQARSLIQADPLNMDQASKK